VRVRAAHSRSRVDRRDHPVMVSRSTPASSDGFAELWERGRLDLTVEALVAEPKFSELFSENEIAVARRRLEQFGYTP
jgi:hypothetical protein